ncbi:hypothetical protein ACSVC9_04655 [Clostridium sp. LBM24168]
MAGSNFYSLEYISKLEMSCILLVEEELNIFFSKCMKQASVYSRALVDNLILQEKKSFAERVLSDYQIKKCIEAILFRINMEVIKNKVNLDFNALSVESVEECYDRLLKETINNAKITQMTTGICEHIMDYSISLTLNKVCRNNIVNELLKRHISSRKILYKNNLVNQKRKHQELIYKQMKGLLTNIRLSLKNELIKVCITAIDRIEATYSTVI